MILGPIFNPDLTALELVISSSRGLIHSLSYTNCSTSGFGPATESYNSPGVGAYSLTAHKGA